MNVFNGATEIAGVAIVAQSKMQGWTSREWTLWEWLVVEKVCAHRKVSVIHLVGLCVAVIFGKCCTKQKLSCSL